MTPEPDTAAVSIRRGWLTHDELHARLVVEAGDDDWVVHRVLGQARYADLPDAISPELAGKLRGEVRLWLNAVASGVVEPPRADGAPVAPL